MITQRIVRRFLAAKKPTFQEVRQKVFAFLKSKNWKIAENNKIPHATSPDGKTRLWFKAQADYAVSDRNRDEGSDPLKFENSHSMTSDLRDYIDESKFEALVERWTGQKV